MPKNGVVLVVKIGALILGSQIVPPIRGPGLFPDWSQFGPSLGQFGASSGPIWSKLDPSWSQFEPNLVTVWLGIAPSLVKVWSQIGINLSLV